MPPLKSFQYRNPSSILSKLSVLSWWSPLDAMDLRLISRHHTIWVSSWENHWVLILSLFCRDGAERVRHTIHYFENLPGINAHVIRAVLTSIGNCSFALFSVNFALLDRSKKYLNKQKQP